MRRAKPDCVGHLSADAFTYSAQNQVWQRMLSGIDATVLTSAEGYLRKLIQHAASMSRDEGPQFSNDLKPDDDIQRGKGRGRER